MSAEPEPKAQTSGITRRDWLKLTAGGAALVMLAAWRGISANCGCGSVPRREAALNVLALRWMAHAPRPQAVLIVDDEPSLLELLRSVLTDEGYEVTTAPDGIAALDTLETHAFNAIVSDFMMPGMDGVRLFEVLRRRGDDTFFILMTSLPLNRVKAVCPTCNAYLQKPFTIDALLAKLK